jgi:hypothetical protein
MIVLALSAAAPGTAAAKRKRGPVNATVTVDRGRAASVTLTPSAGATLAVKARNGARITISFPQGSVAATTKVTATPLRKLKSRITRKGLVAGVQLAPEGLNLLRPATVRVARRGRAPKGTKLSFLGSFGSGRDLYRVPPDGRVRGRRFKASGRPVATITHFSTIDAFDWSKATLQDLNALLYPAVGIHRMSQEISRLLSDPNATLAEIQEAVERERKRFIDPLTQQALAALKSSCSEKAIRRAQDVMSIALSFERQMQLVGLGEIGAVPLLSKMLLEAARCMSKLCPTLGDPRAAMYFLGLARQLQLVGAGSQALFAALFVNLERCATYEVRLVTQVTGRGEGNSFTWHLASTVKVQPKLEESGGLPVRAPLEYTHTSGTAPSFCTVTSIVGTTPGVLEVKKVDFTSYSPSRPSADPLLGLELAIPVQPFETYHETPTGGENCGDPPPDYPLPQWFAAFQALHPGFRFEGSDFVPDAPPVVAIAVYQKSIDLGNGGIDENTKVELVHTPQEPVPLPDSDPEPAEQG